MKLSDFDYKLPDGLIAQNGVEPRDHSKLLIVNPKNKKIEEKKFFEIANFLGKNDVLVVNNTKVINARLKGYFYNFLEEKKDCEVFLHKQISDNYWECLVYPGKKLKIGKKIFFDLPLDYKSKENFNNKDKLQLTAKVLEITDSGRIVEFSIGGVEFLEIIDKIGNTPLPPYIKENFQDSERYQTVFNEISGSVAAPTAGLHFTENLLKKLEKKGVKIEKVLLQVGLGTFKNVETENILEHKMHSEYIELSEESAKKLNNYKSQGKRIIAVGTTSIRVLESFSGKDGILKPGKKETNIFIYPGYKWKFVDSIITNFHLPKSTLLMLISSFAGKSFIRKAYEYAIKNKFRFFSFGDAMWIEDIDTNNF